jgi:hypothetical protein
MNTRNAAIREYAQRGFILATVLVFLVVLSLTAFLAARLTRTDIQVVNNLQNEKEALSIAEAGIHEALYRLSLAIGGNSTVNGQTFDASLAPRVPDRLPSGTFYGIDYANTQSTSQLIFTTSGVPAPGLNNVVPTLQPTSLQLPYSFSSADTAPVSLGSTANLTIGWDVCGAPAPSIGCDTVNSFYPIKGLPISSPRPVAKIVSTGRSGSATRKITAWVVDCVPGQTPGNGSLVALDQACPNPGGIYFNGRNHLDAPDGTIQVNAGYTSPCTNAAHTGGSQSYMQGQSISVSGDTSGNGSFTPAPRTGGLPVADPYSNLVRPCYTGGPGVGGNPGMCQGAAATVTTVRSASTLVVNSNGATIQPGIYYGGIDVRANNVTMASGYYIIIGGAGLTVGNNASVYSAPGGVMIFYTADAAHPPNQPPNPPVSLNLTNGNTDPNFTAISDPNDPFYGVVYVQERAPTLPLTQPQLNIQGGGVGRTLDGLVYAPDAHLHVYGNQAVSVGGALIVKSVDFAGNSGLDVNAALGGGPATQCGGLAYQIIGWQDWQD